MTRNAAKTGVKGQKGCQGLFLAAFFVAWASYSVCNADSPQSLTPSAKSGNSSGVSQDENLKGVDFDLPTAKTEGKASDEKALAAPPSMEPNSAWRNARNKEPKYPIDGSRHDVQIDVIPFSPVVEATGRMPEFLAVHRVFQKRGHSRRRLVEVQSNGKLKELRAWRDKAEGGEDVVDWDLTQHHQNKVPPSYQFPNPNWKIKVEGWFGGNDSPKDGLRLIYKNGPGPDEKTFKIPDWGLTFGCYPIFYDPEKNIIYFT